jgi:predicted DNA-binding transcriptional regulator YafY
LLFSPTHVVIRAAVATYLIHPVFGIFSETKDMPRIKSSEQRLKIIDKLLSGPRIIEDRKALLDLVNAEIDPESIGLEMLDKDLRELRDLAQREDVDIRWTKTNGYRYDTPGYRYFQKALTDEEKVMLVLAQNLFQTFRQTPLKEKFRDLVEKVIGNDGSAKFLESNKGQKFIQPEWDNESPGTRFLPDLITAIHEKQQIQVIYAGEKKNLSPYVLKQNKGLWYLVAYDHNKRGDEAIKIYSLNRIRQILPGKLDYYKDPQFRAEDYFKYSLGIWHRYDGAPIDVVLEFSHPRLIEHIAQNKIHPTQKLLKETSKSLRIQITVYESIELENLVLGYGEDVRVISPKSLKDRLAVRVKALGKFY